MFIDLIKELVLELIRTLLLEDICQRVKEGLVMRKCSRRLRSHQALCRWLHIRNRDRLLHRIATGHREEL